MRSHSSWVKRRGPRDIFQPRTRLSRPWALLTWLRSTQGCSEQHWIVLDISERQKCMAKNVLMYLLKSHWLFLKLNTFYLLPCCCLLGMPATVSIWSCWSIFWISRGCSMPSFGQPQNLWLVKFGFCLNCIGLIVIIIDELFLRMLKSEQGFCSIVSQLWMNVECPLVNVGVIFPVPNSFDHSWNYAQWWTVKVQSSSIMAQWWIQSLNQWTLAPPICRLAETVLEIGRIQSGKGVLIVPPGWIVPVKATAHCGLGRRFQLS